MSAYNSRPPGQVISLNPDDTVRNMHSEIDTYLDISRQVEVALSQGRITCKKLKDELASLQGRHEEALRHFERRHRETQAREKETQARELQHQARENELKGALTAQQEKEAKLAREMKSITSQAEEVRGAARRQNEAYTLREEKFKSAIMAQRSRETQLLARIAQLQENDSKLVSQLQSLNQQAETLRGELTRAQKQMGEFRGTAQEKFSAFAKREEQFKSAITTHRTREAELTAKMTQLQEALARAEDEIKLYKNSWTQVLQMDRDAKTHLKHKEEKDSRIQKLETENQRLENEKQELVSARHNLLLEAQAKAAEMASQEKDLRAKLEAANSQIEHIKSAAQGRITSLHHELEKTRLETEKARMVNQNVRAEAIQEVRIEALVEDFAKAKLTGQQLEEESKKMKQQLEAALHEAEEARARKEESQALKQQLESALAEAGEARAKTDKLRRHYPLRDLLSHKEAEVTRAVRELKNLPSDNPSRKKAEDIVETLVDQRDQLRKILHEAEQR